MACLLGIEDEAVGKEDILDYKTNKVGGKPNWASGEYSNPKCKICSNDMLLALQIYAPLDDSTNHRTLYIFCCLHPQCHNKQFGGWVCLRDEVLDTASPEPKPFTRGVSSSETWIDGADDWGDEENIEGHNGNSSNNNDNAEVEVDCVGIKRLSICDEKAIMESNPTENASSAEVEGMDESVTIDDHPTKPTTDIRSLLAINSTPLLPEPEKSQFYSFYLNVIEEQVIKTAADKQLDQHAKELWLKYQSKEKCDWKNVDTTKATSVGEAYEKVPPVHGDHLVHKFVMRVQPYSEQLVRYSRNSNPLLLKPLTKDTVASHKHCRYCGAELIFEMQLMPHLSQRLVLLDFAANGNPVELGTVLVYTCSKSCWEGSLREESVFVQAEMY